MSDKINELIQEIAIKHKVVLSKDDPILIFHTMNEKMLEESRKAHEDLLIRFKEEMELISFQWKNDAKEKAEKILNAALVGSKEAMSRLLQESTNESMQAMKSMFLDSIAEACELAQKSRKFSWIALCSSTAILFGSCLISLL